MSIYSLEWQMKALDLKSPFLGRYIYSYLARFCTVAMSMLAIELLAAVGDIC